MSVSRNENPFKKSLMSCPKGASRLNSQDKRTLSVSVYSLICYLISTLFIYTANESTLYQFPHHQTLVPWPGTGSDTMASPSVLSTHPNYSISNSYYDNNVLGSLLAMDSSSRLDSPALTGNLPSAIRPRTSFETTVLPDEPVIKTKAEVMANVPRSFNGVRFSSMFKESALECPFSHFPAYPDFKQLAYGLPTLPWIQST